MRTLIRIVVPKLVASRVGRWTLTILLLVIGAAGLATYPGLAATAAQSACATLTRDRLLP